MVVGAKSGQQSQQGELFTIPLQGGPSAVSVAERDPDNTGSNNRFSRQDYDLRYRVQREKQREALDKDAFLKQCMPCCVTTRDGSLGGFISDLSRSVAMMLSLQIMVLTLGVAKEALGYRGLMPHHIIITTIETIIACLLVVTNVLFIITLYRQSLGVLLSPSTPTRRSSLPNIGSVLTKSSSFSIGSVSFSKMPSYMKLYILFGLSLVAVMLGCFALFLFVLHHGWTVLSNNACLVLITAYTSVLQRRLVRNTSQMILDENKVAMCELLLLLTETRKVQTEQEQRETLSRVECVTEMLSKVDIYKKPSYIVREHQGVASKLEGIEGTAVSDHILTRL